MAYPSASSRNEQRIQCALWLFSSSCIEEILRKRRLGEGDLSEFSRSLEVAVHDISSSKTPWSLVAIFFLFLLSFSSSLPFIFGRIVNIEPFTQRQYNKYGEVPIFGDLSDEDILHSKGTANAMEGVRVSFARNYILRLIILSGLCNDVDVDAVRVSCQFTETSLLPLWK